MCCDWELRRWFPTPYFAFVPFDLSLATFPLGLVMPEAEVLMLFPPTAGSIFGNLSAFTEARCTSED